MTTTYHVYRCYADDAEKAVEVYATTERAAIFAGAMKLGCNEKQVIARYVITRTEVK